MQKKIMDLDWSVLLHQPYSPDLALSDYHLFCSKQKPLIDKNFFQEDQMKTFLENFLSLKAAEWVFYDNVHCKG